jgi:hypothetical protein
VLLKSGIVETLITNIFDDEIAPADFKRKFQTPKVGSAPLLSGFRAFLNVEM